MKSLNSILYPLLVSNIAVLLVAVVCRPCYNRKTIEMEYVCALADADRQRYVDRVKSSGIDK